MTDTCLQTSISRLWYDDGIVHWEYHPGVQVTLEHAREEIAVLHKLRDGKQSSCLVDLRTVKSVDGEARSYFSGPEVASLIKRVAFLVDSPVSRIIGNFFIGLNKPPFPSRIFTSEASALQWLKEIGT